MDKSTAAAAPKSADRVAARIATPLVAGLVAVAPTTHSSQVRKAYAIAATVVAPVDLSLALRLMVARRCFATSVKR